MTPKTAESAWRNWRKPTYYFAAAWFAFWFSMMIAHGMEAIFSAGFLLILPTFLVSFSLVIALILAAVNRTERRNALQIFVWLVILLGIPLSVYSFEWSHPLAISEKVTWLARSEKYKRDFWIDSAFTKGELRHSNWEMEGPSFATIYTYLVFDPTNSLASAGKSHYPGKYPGLPCEVDEVRRLESSWYVVLAREPWNECN